VDQLIERGLRARLETESFVTGVLYVSLDVHSEAPVNLVNLPGAKYKEIPTIPTALEQMRSAAAQLVDKLEEIKFDELVASATEAVEGLSKITNSPKVRAAADSLEGTLRGFDETMASIRKLADNTNATIARLEENVDPTAEEAAEALRESAATMRALRAVLEPDSPTMYKVGKTLDEVAAAARGIRELSDYLERNPSSLLRGKEIPEEER
jgi:paraquat-inducible protein B